MKKDLVFFLSMGHTFETFFGYKKSFMLQQIKSLFYIRSNTR